MNQTCLTINLKEYLAFCKQQRERARAGIEDEHTKDMRETRLCNLVGLWASQYHDDHAYEVSDILNTMMIEWKALFYPMNAYPFARDGAECWHFHNNKKHHLNPLVDEFINWALEQKP